MIMNQEEYKNLRDMHTKAFGDTFAKAFEGNEEAQSILTVALLYLSRQDFDKAKPQLEMLESIAENFFDEASMWYFSGLCFEIMGNQKEMAHCYEKVLNSGVNLTVSLAFFPYYRTAKLCQKASQAKKAVYYFSKSLEFFQGRNVTPATAKAVSQMLYDVATVYLYMHDYENCEKFLNLSQNYDDGKNLQRDYVKATLQAVKGNAEKCNLIIKSLQHPTLEASCLKTTQAILKGTDLHYCIVPQDRDNFEDFLTGFEENRELMKNQISEGNSEVVAQSLSNVLSAVFNYVNRVIECEIQMNNDMVIVKCKNYYIRTLKKEQEALFSQISEQFPDWNFLSVEE